MLYLTGWGFYIFLAGGGGGGGSIRWNEEELIACGDCADYILNLKLSSFAHGSETVFSQTMTEQAQ